MTDQNERDLESWRTKIKERGIASVRAEVAGTRDENFHTGTAAIAEYEETQASTRHDELKVEEDTTHRLQKHGNYIQLGVLFVLFLTLVSTCRGG